MTVCNTTDGKRFILEKSRLLGRVNGATFFLTASGNVVRGTDDGQWSPVLMSAVEDNILLLPYDIAAELFPTNPALQETI